MSLPVTCFDGGYHSSNVTEDTGRLLHSGGQQPRPAPPGTTGWWVQLTGHLRYPAMAMFSCWLLCSCADALICITMQASQCPVVGGPGGWRHYGHWPTCSDLEATRGYTSTTASVETAPEARVSLCYVSIRGCSVSWLPAALLAAGDWSSVHSWGPHCRQLASLHTPHTTLHPSMLQLNL